MLRIFCICLQFPPYYNSVFISFMFISGGLGGNDI